MAVWSWKRSGWVNATLATSLIAAVISAVCSIGFRTGFTHLVTKFNFYGGLYPEIALFNLFLYISALFGVMCVSLRYSYIIDQNQVMPSAIQYANKIAIAFGFLSFLGLVIVASFPVSLDEQRTFQSTGTYMFIGLGFGFTILQTILTFTNLRFSFPFFIRLCMAVVLMSTFISSLVLIQKNKEVHSFMNITVTSDNETHAITIPTSNQEQLAACCLVWISVVVYALYFLSFFHEFQTISTYVILRPFIAPSSDMRTSSLTVNERV